MPDVTDEQKAEIVMLKGLNYDGSEIAEVVGVSESSVYGYLNRFEDRAKAAENWRVVYWKVVLGGVFGDRFIDTLTESLV